MYNFIYIKYEYVIYKCSYIIINITVYNLYSIEGIMCDLFMCHVK